MNGSIPRIFINKKKVWLSKNSIIIYEPNSFYGKTANESRKYAVFTLQETIKKLEKTLKLSLGKYIFKPSREHYGMIRNVLAQQCNKNGDKIKVSDELDGEWLWIDDSEGMFGELETGGKGITKDRAGLNRDVQHWFNDHKKHNFKVTPSYIQEGFKQTNGMIQQVTENQLMFNKNFESHVASIKTLGHSAESNAKSTELLASTILQMKNSFELQIESLKKEIKRIGS